MLEALYSRAHGVRLMVTLKLELARGSTASAQRGSLALTFRVYLNTRCRTADFGLVVLPRETHWYVPSIFGDLSESIGRRPVYLINFSIYCAASVGLALQRSYVALLLLRMLQSARSSGAIALAHGVIGDIAAPHERGIYVGTTHIGFNSAPALEPVIGGLLAQRVGWPWIFVFLAGFSGALLAFLGLFLHET